MSLQPGAPQPASKPSARTFGGHGGRKLVESEKSKTAGHEEKKPPRVKKLTSMDDIDRILENDALDLVNMKKDVVHVQQSEVNKSRQLLADIQRQFDTLHVANNLKEKEYQGLLDSITTLQNVGLARVETTGQAESVKTSLATECEEVMEMLAAEQRTFKMQSHMIHRLEKEIVECKSESALVQFSCDQSKHELTSVDSTLRISRQELLEQERVLEQLQQTVKSRKEQREEKMAMMNNIVSEGEHSVAKVQRAASTSLQQRSHHSQNSRDLGGHMRATGSRGHSSSMARRGGGAGEAVTEKPTDPHECFSSKQLSDIMERFSTKDSRLQKIVQQEADLREALVVQHRRKEELSEQLVQTATKHQQLASSRQVYQEVDMKDAALASARKECEECKEREHRLRLNIESLTRAFPRFLTKITRVIHPIPTLDQLPDAVHKLEDEISKLIKTIDTAMLKDATAEDLASISQATSSANADGVLSEIDRLQKLPGYERLQRQLFFNLMGARPDYSDQNVRIKVPHPPGLATPPGAGAGRASRGTDAAASANPWQTNRYEEKTELNEALPGVAISDTQSLDRTTIKNISKLVIEKDQRSKSAATKPASSKSSRR